MKNNIIIFMIIGLSLISCGTNQETKQTKNDKQLNITFLLDLSDRIEPQKYPNTPEHYERDIEIINEFVNVFKADMNKKKNFNMKGKMKVLFMPNPKDHNINEIAKKLNVNTSNMKPAEKTSIYNNLQTEFSENLKKIYEQTLANKKYIGSDIWRFFKNDVTDLAIEQDTNYRNILVLITDGYIYHKDTKIKEKNRYSYILPKIIQQMGLTNSNWKQKIEELDFGLIPVNKKLNNLEVLMLEINPSKKSSPYEEDILTEVLSKWFKEMEIKKIAIYKTDLPNITKQKINNFIKNK